MVSVYVVAGYLVLWLVLRLAALRSSKPGTVVRRSPWLTRLVLVYCFVLSVFFVAAKTWLEDGNWEENPVRLAIGICIAGVALVADTLCMRSLCPFYSLEMEIKPDHAVIKRVQLA